MKTLLSIVLAGSIFSSTAFSWEALPVAVPGKVISIADTEQFILIETDRGWWRSSKANFSGKWESTKAPVQNRPEGALADGQVVMSAQLGRVYLAGATTRYKHAVLGDAIEADAVVVQRENGIKQIVKAGSNAVFEDLIPRLADLDGDGIPEILVVKSYLDRGAALAVIGRNARGELKLLDETPAIGTPNRWLNPAGAANFTGGKEMEIALVRMPHALGKLELWRWAKGKLLKLLELSDVSNHAIGSRSLGLSAVADFNGDGIPDLAIPSFDRRSLRLLSFKENTREIARIPLPDRVATDIVLLDGALVFGLADGRLIRVQR